jgi:hypothetical protein
LSLTVQQQIAAFLSAQGQHHAAKLALESTNRTEWTKLVEIAIRTAPEYNRTHVAHTLRYEMDKPVNGGANTAADFILKPEAHPMREGEQLNRAWMINDNRTLSDTCMVSADVEALKRRVVGLYVVRAIVIGQHD